MSNDTVILAAQIGRPLRATSLVVHRCTWQLPVVAQVPPVLDSGEPFPTRYWLTCPLAHRRVARIEAQGGVREAQTRVDTDATYAEQLREAHRRYAQERDALVPPDALRKPTGGIAGVNGDGADGETPTVKCLHAHLADHLAGNANPIGSDVAQQVTPLHCAAPCVVPSAERAGEYIRNAEWREVG